jgi:hemolysin III
MLRRQVPGEAVQAPHRLQSHRHARACDIPRPLVKGTWGVNHVNDDLAVPLRKPRLRGVSHLVAFFAALAGWAARAREAGSTRGIVAASVYGASLAVMFGTSALYHGPTWSTRSRRLLRRLDHAAIFALIAGTYAPLCLALEPRPGVALLTFVATCALFGIVRVIVFPDAPRYVAVPIYLALGWAIFPLVPTVRATVGTGGLALLAAGGVAYSAGAVIYWVRRPDPVPEVFGYHEIFHLLVIAAAACHYAVIFPVVAALR